MATNEFRWGVKPPIPGHLHDVLRQDGCDVEIAGDWIEARVADDGQAAIQQRRAQQAVDAMLRAIGVQEKTKFTAIFGSQSRFDPDSNSRDVAVAVPGEELRLSGHVDFVLASADGTVVADSCKERMAELLQVSSAYAKNEVSEPSDASRRTPRGCSKTVPRRSIRWQVLALAAPNHWADATPTQIHESRR